MKQIIGCVLICCVVLSLQAKTPGTQVPMQHPTTTATVIHPMTQVEVLHPTTSTVVVHPATQTQVFHPRTTVTVVHPTTQVQVVHPQTTVQVIHPQTTVQVVHPQTTVEVFHPRTPQELNETEGNKGFTAGRSRSVGSSAAQVTTSMSDFKPMQAKSFTSKPADDKAAQVGGGSMDLGNTTDETEKDNASKASALGGQKTMQNIELDPKKTNIQGLEKLITDRAKEQEKKK